MCTHTLDPNISFHFVSTERLFVGYEKINERFVLEFMLLLHSTSLLYLQSVFFFLIYILFTFYCFLWCKCVYSVSCYFFSTINFYFSVAGVEFIFNICVSIVFFFILLISSYEYIHFSCGVLMLILPFFQHQQ